MLHCPEKKTQSKGYSAQLTHLMLHSDLTLNCVLLLPQPAEMTYSVSCTYRTSVSLSHFHSSAYCLTHTQKGAWNMLESHLCVWESCAPYVTDVIRVLAVCENAFFNRRLTGLWSQRLTEFISDVGSQLDAGSRSANPLTTVPPHFPNDVPTCSP